MRLTPAQLRTLHLPGGRLTPALAKAQHDAKLQVVRLLRSYYTKSGCPLGHIAEIAGYSRPSAISRLFCEYGYGGLYPLRTCALPECSTEFYPERNGRYCCRTHLKLAASRSHRGKVSVQLPCALPECQETFWSVKPSTGKPIIGGLRDGEGSARRYCCQQHAVLHKYRVRSGAYLAALKGDNKACEVCGFDVIVDCHHEVWTRRGGSDKGSRTHWLCPTHHMMIHRSFAVFIEGIYQMIDPPIKVSDNALLPHIHKKLRYYRYKDIEAVARKAGIPFPSRA